MSITPGSARVSATGSTRRNLIGALTGLTVIALAVPAVTGVAPPAAAAPPRAEISLQDISPVSVEPGKVLRIQGSITSDAKLTGVTIGLEVGTSPFLTRGSVAEAATDPPVTNPVPGVTDTLGKLKAGGSRRFTLAVETDDLLLASAELPPGVYPARIVASAGPTGEIIDTVSTFLPWVTGQAISPSRLLMIWPLIDIPRRDATGAFTVPGLGEELRPGGRLSTLTASGAGADVSWVIDASLLADVAALATEPAQRWLAELPRAIGVQEASIVPFGDPDVAAVTTADELALLRRATARAEQVAEQTLAGREVRTDFAWPADGAADPEVIDRARRAGSAVFLLDETTAPLTTELFYTPSGRIQQLDPEVELLLADRPASALAASPANSRSDVVLSRQRYLAETLLHSLELPTESRLLVVAPPRRWNPSPGWARALVDATSQASWLRPVSIEEALRPGAPVVERVDPTIPEPALARQLPTQLVTNAALAQPQARKFRAILTRPGILGRPIEDAVYTSVSTAWRSDHDAAAVAQERTLERLKTQRDKVRIVSRGGTLSDDRGQLPVTIRNELDQAVAVRLSVTSTDPLRLRVQAPDGRIRVAPAGVESVSVELDAVTSGRLPIDAQILTPNGNPYAEPVRLQVDVRAYGRVAIIVFGAAASLMILAALVRIVRRIRNRHRRPA